MSSASASPHHSELDSTSTVSHDGETAGEVIEGISGSIGDTVFLMVVASVDINMVDPYFAASLFQLPADLSTTVRL